MDQPTGSGRLGFRKLLLAHTIVEMGRDKHQFNSFRVVGCDRARRSVCTRSYNTVNTEGNVPFDCFFALADYLCY